MTPLANCNACIPVVGVSSHIKRILTLTLMFQCCVNAASGSPASVQQHEAAGAIGVLRLVLAAPLPKHRSHLVAQAPRDGHPFQRAAVDVAARDPHPAWNS